ncbi:hypothetical protein JL475_34345 [Streptomyces sp. M2CJ-2]|uniref:hypothetical protein n=1 Tax=Streptomyces sp. M2CJ-2 TaxID=2803948 RepID=UPI00192959CB|nr:hypothetical protein [Streptomyces sp. M2CJ-2]MBL3670941.1 hypothetical protein [Streptomyces sp. M2CJ-2]
MLSSLGMLLGAAQPSSAGTPDERPCVVDGASAMPDWTWTSATTVERQLTMDSDADDRAEPLMASIQPRIDPAAYADGEPGEALLRPVGPLGHLGPLGPWGPLGRYGPLGEASAYWETQLDHLRHHPFFASLLDTWGILAQPVLGETGPLGPAGPVGQEAYCENLPALNEISGQLQAGGVYGPLGPAGPLGVYGPLGPLGPRGPMGVLLDPADGRYYDNGKLVTKVEGAAPWGSGQRRMYELVETYPRGRAHAADVALDTSFMATDVTTPGRPTEYTMTSAEDQFVTVTVVPDRGFADLSCMFNAYGFNPCGVYPALAAFPNGAAVDTEDILIRNVFHLPASWKSPQEIADRYTVELLDGAGNVVAESRASRYVNWLQIKVPAGSELTARVTLNSTWDEEQTTAEYHLAVTGSTEWVGSVGFSGAHQAGPGPL